MELIERRLGGGVVAGYIQGCCGDINPAGLDGELILSGHDEDVRRIGNELGEQSLRVLEQGLRPIASCPLRVITNTVMLPVQKVPSITELEALAGEPWVTGDWSRKLFAEPEGLQTEIPLRIVMLTLAEGLSLLAANAEIVVEYGLYIKSLTADRGLPLGYTNGMIGYTQRLRKSKRAAMNLSGQRPISCYHPIRSGG